MTIRKPERDTGSRRTARCQLERSEGLRFPRPWRAALPVVLVIMLFGSCTQSASTPITPATGTLRTDSLWSPSLGVWKRLVVYLPPGYAHDADERHPVAYYLHGMWGSEDNWSAQGRIGAIADSLIARGMPELIIVMPDGDNGYYTTWATPGNYEACRQQPPIPEPAATYCVPTPRYDEYLARDVVRHVDSTWRTLADPAHRAVAGLSMGGYGAVTLALRHPEVWSAAASHSGVLALIMRGRSADGAPVGAPNGDALERIWGPRFWPLIEPVFGRDTAGWWAREPARLARERASSGVSPPALFIDVGVADGLVLEGNRLFVDELRRLGMPAEYHEWPGAHTWEYWRAHVPESLAWIAELIGA